MRKFLYFFLSIILVVFSTLGCSRMGGSTVAGSHQADKEQAQRMKGIIQKFSEGEKSINSPLWDKLKKANDEDRAEILMDFADDMAKTQFFGLTNNEVISMVGQVVKDYPHPLLLNNFGTMLTETAPEDGLYLLLQALDYEPGNPLIRTNIANMYIQMGDFGAAERYAKEALASNPDFGPAYQVLTTCHLKNGNSILAAETMVKSAKPFFNDLTIYHFENFLDAVDEQLDPKEDEYPLKEEFINELYYIAKENVDTLDVSQTVDIPEAQLTLQNLPNIHSPGDLRFYTDYFYEEQDETWDHYLELEDKYLKYGILIDKEEDQEKSSKGLVYPIEKNLRQKYAFEVLRSFYVFKMEKSKLILEDEIETICIDEEKQDKVIHKKYTDLQDQNALRIENLGKDVQKAFDAGDVFGAGAIMEELERIGASAAIKSAELEVEKEKEILKNKEDIAQKMKDLIYIYYAEIKQTLEEYWLRSGGIIKYITQENVFHLLDTQRRMDVEDYISDALNKMMGCASIIKAQYEDIAAAEKNLALMMSITDADASEKEEKEKQRKAENLKPDMEEGVLSTYPEKNAVGELGVEFNFFEMLSASGQTDGTDYSLEVSGNLGIFKGSIGGKTITEKDQKTGLDVVSKEAYTTIGVDVKIDGDSLIPERLIGKAASKRLGSIGFGSSESISKFNVMSSDNKITDRGTYKTTEVSMQAGLVGSTKQSTIRRSSMTGVAIRNKSIKYKFAFLTYTVPNN